MGFNRFIKLRGLNKRLVAVDKINVLFLEEHELDGNLVTNVHLSNGKWVTSALSLNEVMGELSAQDAQDSEAQLNKWKENARMRREAEMEVEAVMREMKITIKPKGYHTEKNSDGSWKMTLEFDKEETKSES